MLDSGRPPAGASTVSPAGALSAAAEGYSLETLEFPAVRELLARQTSFSASRALARELTPTGDLAEAQRLQDETTEALRLPGLRPSLHFGGVHDIRPAVGRARVGGTLLPTELLEVGSTVRGARAWRRGLFGLREELPTLAEIAAFQLADHSGLVEAIEDAVSDSGELLDTASPLLARTRAELRGAHARLVTRLREIMSQPPYRDAVQDPVVTQRGGRYVIPIRAEARGQTPGIVHDQSASGATVFLEPLAAVELANRWRTLQVEEEREVERILRVLSQEVGSQAETLDGSVVGLARLDLAQAKARLASEQLATAPRLTALPAPPGAASLRLVEARHPLLAGNVVPVSLSLGEDFDQLVITGPNTGGKTVALKTAGLLSLMALAGLHLPARAGSTVGVFRCVQADIGDEQSLQQSLSTFSSHVTRIARMLAQADGSSLILLDELGAGTDPREGAALARAILRYLQDRGAYVVATTHYPELKAYAELTPRVENASVEFDLETLSPTYRLQVGIAGQSNALAIARRLGLPEALLEDARGAIAPQFLEAEGLLAQAARERAEAEQARQHAEREAARAYREATAARAARQEAEQLRTRARTRAEADAAAELLDLRREAQRLRQQLRSQSRAGPGARQAVDEVLRLELPAPPVTAPTDDPTASAKERAAGPLRVGTEVVVPKLGLAGRLLSLRDGEAEVEVLGRRVRLAVADLEVGTVPPGGSSPAAPGEVPAVTLAATPRGDVSLALDLRGQRRQEALEQLETYLEDAALAGLPFVRIVHGKATGTIRQAVREALRQSRWVQRFAPEPDPAGGDGATLAWLTT